MVMNAWANVAAEHESGREATNAASRCEEILNRMEERGAQDDGGVRPNLVAYVTSITAWARAAAANSRSSRRYDDGVVGCSAASKAEHILNRMIDLYYNEDDAEAEAEAEEEDEDERMSSSLASSLDGGDLENANYDAPFNSVITAYARSRDPYAAERALAVLQRLEDLPAVSPTVTSYNAVLDCCAKHKEPERALEVFDRMKEMGIQPNSTSFDTVLNAFARQDEEGSAARAWDFLRRLIEEAKSPSLESSNNNNFLPSVVSYSTVLNAFARASGNKDYGGIHAVKSAKGIYNQYLDQMEDGTLYVRRADSFANSCFLNCCANVHGSRSEKKEALVMAIMAFEDMKKRPDIVGDPNQYTFGTMMKVCSRLSSDEDERHRLMESLFVQACQRGLLSRSTMGQFLKYTPTHLNMKVILSLGGSKREIPESWYRHVPRKHWPAAMENQQNRY